MGKAPTSPKMGLIKLDATVDKNDLVTIKVAQFEQAMMRREEELKAQIEVDQKRVETLEKEVTSDLLEAARAEALSRAQEIAKLVKSLTAEPLEASVNLGNLEVGDDVDYDEDDEEAKTTTAVKGSKFTFTVKIGAPRCGTNITFALDRAVPKAIRTKLGLQAMANKAIEKAMTEIVSIRGKLSKIPTVERSVRAQLAAAKLREDGNEALLEDILANDLPGLNLLPAPKK